MKICISSFCFQRGRQKGRKNRYDDVRGGILSLWKALVFLLLFSFFLTYCLSPARYPLSITFQSVVSRLDHRDSGSLLASGVANKKDKEQMVVFVIPSSFQPPGKPLLPLVPSLSHSLSTSLSLSLSHSAIWMGPNLCNASSLVGMDLNNQMVRLFGAINSLRESVGTCLQQRFGGRSVECVEWHSSLKSLLGGEKKCLEGAKGWGSLVGGSRKDGVKRGAAKARVKRESDDGNFS